MSQVIIVGCGDIGRRVAALHRARADKVAGVVRSDAAGLAAAGIEAIRADLDRPSLLPDLPTAGALLYYFAPPPETGSTDPRMRVFLSMPAMGQFALGPGVSGSDTFVPSDPEDSQNPPSPPFAKGGDESGNILSSDVRQPVPLLPPLEKEEWEGFRDIRCLPKRLVYISTSGVYGDCRGEWVNEDTPIHPQTERAKRRADAEAALQAWSRRTGVPVVVLRVGGIYGPGRLPVDRIKAGRPVLREEESGFTNRIHADDLAHACVAAMERGAPGGHYNVSDGRPGTMTQYFNAVADLLGLPRPPQITRAQAEQELNASLLSFLNESRRLDNRKMLRDLGVTLRYPDLASGLAACAPEHRD